MSHEILLVFVPMFFAMDPVGLLPIFVALTTGLDKSAKEKIIIQSLATASLVAVGFIFLGRWAFALLGITMGDFMVAGGLILCCLSILDLCGRSKTPQFDADDVGAVPIGTPLIVGPAVLTMSLILMPQYGPVVTLGAVFMNIFIVGIIFIFSDFLIQVIGKSGSMALSKVLSLLLAAIGIMMIRRGILEMVTTVRS